VSNRPNQPYPQQQFAPLPSQYPTPQQPAPKKRRTWLWITLAVVAGLIVIGVAANNANNGSGTSPTGAPAGNEANAPNDPEPAKASENVVIYRVTGVGVASSITYVTDGATTINQETNVRLPWKKTIRLPAGEALQMVSLTAQGSSDNGKINVVIKVNGKVVKQAHATGYGVASADENIGTLR
jgi:Mycobacterium membrane protein